MTINGVTALLVTLGAQSIASPSVAQETSGVQLVHVADIVPENLTSRGLRISMSEDGCSILVERRIFHDEQESVRIVEPENLPIPGKSSFDLQCVLDFDPTTREVSILNSPNENGKWSLNGKQIADWSRRQIAAEQLAPWEITDQEKNWSTPDGVKFEDTVGTPVIPGQDLRFWYNRYGMTSSAEGLFVIYKNQKMRVTPEGVMVKRFTYDSLKQRVFTDSWPYILFDLQSGERRICKPPNGGKKAEQYYHLIPGHDALVLHENFLNERADDIVGLALHLCDLDGNIIQELPLTTEANQQNHYPWHIVCSQEIVAYYSSDGEKGFIRVYAVEEKD